MTQIKTRNQVFIEEDEASISINGIITPLKYFESEYFRDSLFCFKEVEKNKMNKGESDD